MLLKQWSLFTSYDDYNNTPAKTSTTERIRGVHHYHYHPPATEDAEAFQLICNRHRESVATTYTYSYHTANFTKLSSYRKMGVVANCLLLICTSCFFVAIVALKCHQCGQYNDGVGSITPCINSSYMQLKDCPSLDHRYCIVSKSIWNFLKW